MVALRWRDWAIKSDASGWLVGKARVRRRKDGRESLEMRSPKHYPRLDQLLQHLVDAELRSSGIAALQELVEKQREIRASLEEELVPLVRSRLENGREGWGSPGESDENALEVSEVGSGRV